MKSKQKDNRELKPADARWAKVLRERARKNPKLREFYLTKVARIEQAAQIREANPPWFGRGLKWLTCKKYREELRKKELTERIRNYKPAPLVTETVRFLDREARELRASAVRRTRALKAIEELRKILDGTSRIPKDVLLDFRQGRTSLDLQQQPLALEITVTELIIDAVIRRRMLAGPRGVGGVPTVPTDEEYKLLSRMLDKRHFARVWRRYRSQTIVPSSESEMGTYQQYKPYDRLHDKTGLTFGQWQEFARAERLRLSPHTRDAAIAIIESMKKTVPPPLSPKDHLQILRREPGCGGMVPQVVDPNLAADPALRRQNGSTRIATERELSVESWRDLPPKSVDHTIDAARLRAAWGKFTPLWMEDLATLRKQEVFDRREWSELIETKPKRNRRDAKAKAA